MEPSMIISRCMRQIFRGSNGCRRFLHNGQSRPCTAHPSKSTRYTHRAFSSTTVSQTNGKEDGTQRTEGSSSPSSPLKTVQESKRQSRSQQQDRPKRPSRDGGRIDLSTIPGIDSSYRPPARPDEATAQAKLRSLLGAAPPPPSSPQNRSQPGSANEADYPTSSLDAYTGRRPTPTFDLASLIEDLDRPRRGSNNNNTNTSSDADEPIEVLRLRPTLGRTVNVTPATGFDLTRAFRQLEIKCNANSVKRDEIKQRFHVRRGQQRKIDRRLRWRILFKEGFIAECARIRRMRTQGW